MRPAPWLPQQPYLVEDHRSRRRQAQMGEQRVELEQRHIVQRRVRSPWFRVVNGPAAGVDELTQGQIQPGLVLEPDERQVAVEGLARSFMAAGPEVTVDRDQDLREPEARSSCRPRRAAAPRT